jgi:hypothetical protein
VISLEAVSRGLRVMSMAARFEVQSTCSVVKARSTVSTDRPALTSAWVTASSMAAMVSSTFTGWPRFMPLQGAMPAPSSFITPWGRLSTITARAAVVPTSRAQRRCLPAFI